MLFCTILDPVLDIAYRVGCVNLRERFLRFGLRMVVGVDLGAIPIPVLGVRNGRHPSGFTEEPLIAPTVAAII